jgi:hypothetical protein
LATDGFSDWKHVENRLKEHEISHYHIVAQNKWLNIRKGLECNTIIDTNFQKNINSEKNISVMF